MFSRCSAMFNLSDSSPIFPGISQRFIGQRRSTTRHNVERVAADVGDRRVARASADQLGPFGRELKRDRGPGSYQMWSGRKI